MRVLQPENLTEALALLAESDIPLVPVAGGTDLMVAWQQQEHAGKTLLDLSRLTELRNITFTDTELRLGSLVSFWNVRSAPEICSAFPLLEQAARVVGSVQIQTRGTWGGNIANGSPAADGVTVLLAYDADLILQAQSGSVRIPLAEYFQGYKKSARQPDQLITEIVLPRRNYDFAFFEKVGSRAAQAISRVALAATRNEESGWLVAAASVAPFVTRCRAVESFLNSNTSLASPADLYPAIDRDISPIDDLRASAEYRREVFARVLFYAIQNMTRTGKHVHTT